MRSRVTGLSDVSITSITPTTSNSAWCSVLFVRKPSMALFDYTSFALPITSNIKEYRKRSVVGGNRGAVGNIRLLGSSMWVYNMLVYARKIANSL